MGHAASLRLNLGLAAILLILALGSLFVGYAPLSPAQVIGGLFGSDAETVVVIQSVRLPRLVLGVLVGAAFSIAGAALQGLLRNPLAEPSVIGVAPMAGFGAVIALYFGWTAVTPFALPIAAMLGALAATLLLFAIASRDASVLTLILAGAALSSLAIALTSLAVNFAPNPFAIAEIVYWLMGSLKDRSFAEVSVGAPFMLLGFALLFATGRGLDALSLGEDVAASLGTNLRRLAIFVLAGVSLTVGAATAVTGAIGFVGLVVPHIMRPFVGHEPHRLLLPSALGGAILVVAADTAVRALHTTPELMIGVVTSLIGAPFFLHLIFTTRRSMR
jgi:iron complex transport system permease protein